MRVVARVAFGAWLRIAPCSAFRSEREPFDGAVQSLWHRDDVARLSHRVFDDCRNKYLSSSHSIKENNFRELRSRGFGNYSGWWNESPYPTTNLIEDGNPANCRKALDNIIVFGGFCDATCTRLRHLEIKSSQSLALHIHCPPI